jgi:ribose 5-phosphate isomerase B
MKMKIAIGSDHAAFQLKETIKNLLVELGHTYEDFGAPNEVEPANDYHLTGAEVAQYVVDGQADLGIVMCGTGIGISIAANKVPGASAALCDNIFNARMSREHNNANVLVLGARVVGDVVAKEIVRTWLATDYAQGRHVARNANIGKIERKYNRSG